MVSAPTMTGQERANPVGTILSFAMLLRTSLGLEDAGCRGRKRGQRDDSGGYPHLGHRWRSDACHH